MRGRTKSLSVDIPIAEMAKSRIFIFRYAFLISPLYRTAFLLYCNHGGEDMITQRLYAIAAEKRIYVDELDISLPSMACEIGELKHIALRPGLSDAEEKTCLAHELGHHVRGVLYHRETPAFTRGWCEHRANQWAVHKLIPLRSLVAAFRRGCVEAWQLAEYFGVTEDFVRITVDIYRQEGKLPA